MNIRQALISVANRFEDRPDLYDYTKSTTINGESDIGCLIAHTAVELGHRRRHQFEICRDVCDSLLGVSQNEFFQRLDDLVQTHAWNGNAALAIRALRAYADKYHPAESRALIPASVMKIFDMTPADLRAEFQRIEA